MKLYKISLKQIIVIVLFGLFFSIMLSENKRVYDFSDVPLDEEEHSKFKIPPIYYLYGFLISIGIFLPYFILTNKEEEKNEEKEETKLKMAKKRKKGK